MSEWEPPAASTALGSLPGSVFISGLWYPQLIPLPGTKTATLNDLFAYPFIVNKTHTFSEIGVNVTTGGAGSAVRLGIYADDGAGYPGALMQDYGTVASTGTGTAEIAISLDLDPGLYWLCVAAQGGSAPTLAADNSTFSHIFGSSVAGPVAGNGKTGYVLTGISGSLPNPFTAGAATQVDSPVVQLQA